MQRNTQMHFPNRKYQFLVCILFLIEMSKFSQGCKTQEEPSPTRRTCTSSATGGQTHQTSYSPVVTRSKMKTKSDKLQVLGTYCAEGDTLVELLGPINIQDSAALIITVGHGGKYKPNYIPDRSKNSPYCSKGNFSNCNLVSDLYTDEIGFKLTSQVIENFGKVPYVVINHLHRSKLDVNRIQSAAAQGDPIAEEAWYAYHDFIYQAQSKLKLRFGTVRARNSLDDDIEGVKGLLVDIHGYAGRDWQNDDGSIGPPPFIHWGYGLTGDDLGENSLNATKSTFELASSLPNRDLESLIRGIPSLGSRFYALFNNSDTGNSKYVGAGIPSAEYPNPHTVTKDPHWCNIAKYCQYFSGGYTITQHEYFDWQSGVGQLRMNTVQIELPKQIRFGDGTTANREKAHFDFAKALSSSLIGFLNDLFDLKDTVCNQSFYTGPQIKDSRTCRL